MLDIHGSVDVNSRLEEFFHILIPLHMAASWDIAVRQFVHQDELWVTVKRSNQVELPQLDPTVVRLHSGKDLQPIQQRQSLRSGMGLYIAHHHVNALPFSMVSRLQHGIGLAHPGGIAEKYF